MILQSPESAVITDSSSFLEIRVIFNRELRTPLGLKVSQNVCILEINRDLASNETTTCKHEKTNTVEKFAVLKINHGDGKFLITINITEA